MKALHDETLMRMNRVNKNENDCLDVSCFVLRRRHTPPITRQFSSADRGCLLMALEATRDLVSRSDAFRNCHYHRSFNVHLRIFCFVKIQNLEIYLNRSESINEEIGRQGKRDVHRRR